MKDYVRGAHPSEILTCGHRTQWMSQVITVYRGGRGRGNKSVKACSEYCARILEAKIERHPVHRD